MKQNKAAQAIHGNITLKYTDVLFQKEPLPRCILKFL